MNNNNYYDNNAEKFFNGTVNVDMTYNYKDFLNHIPKGAHILDAGCGSARDSLNFKLLGYKVTAFDGSSEMCKLATKHLNQEVYHMTFEKMKFNTKFDGIWASASLLHLSSEDLPKILSIFKKYLNNNGVFYSSFKYGNFEGKRNERYFNDLTEDTAIELFTKSNFKIIKTWITHDARVHRHNEKWVNILTQ